MFALGEWDHMFLFAGVCQAPSPESDPSPSQAGFVA